MKKLTKMKGVNDPRYDEALAKAQKEGMSFADIAGLLSAAHEAGDARATYALGTWYLHGRHFKRNMRKSIALLRQAAERNVSDALYDLAVCYEKGTGVPKSTHRAAVLYLRAALAGDKQSVYELARCYYYGIGVKQDRAISRAWLDRANQLAISDDGKQQQG